MPAGKIVVTILGVLMLCAGVYCIFAPAATYLSLAWIAGFIMVVEGIGSIFSWREKQLLGWADGWTLAGAIVSLLFGIILLCSMGMQLAFDMMIAYVVAAWILVTGVIRIVTALRLRNASQLLFGSNAGRGTRWTFLLVVGILMVVLGIFSFAEPTVLMVAISWCIGFTVISSALGLICLALA